MGTRGLYGFRKNGIDKLTYNHYDSYPEVLGKNIVKFCKETSLEEMNEIFDRIILVHQDTKPNTQQIEECIEYYNDKVSSGSVDDWYCLLRETQGDLRPYKNGLKYMLDDAEFIKDSLFCEYAYIINLDTNSLEFWKGFQEQPNINNRYGTERTKGYANDWYPCMIQNSYPLEPKLFDKYSVQEYVDDMKGYEDGEIS